MKDPFYNLYNIIHNTALNQNFNVERMFFPELGCNDPNQFFRIYESEIVYHDLISKILIFHDQEPICFTSFKDNWMDKIYNLNRVETNHLLSNSELNSSEKNTLLEKSGWHDFYWFSNGFLSLEWYRFYQYANYLKKCWNPANYFSSYNRIFENRDHRLIVSNHLYQNYTDKIILSCHSTQGFESKNSLKYNVKSITDNLFIKTENNSNENLSYTIHLNDFIDSFCHIVTERIYYEDRIHLTEKVFRPFVCCRPFILVSSPYSLRYLKRYGFKTFDAFWSEKYDEIENHDDRLDEILSVIDYIGSRSHKQILEMLDAMKDILIYNRNYFYSNFRDVITTELFTNFNQALRAKNNQTGYYDQILQNLSKEEYELVKQQKEIVDDRIIGRKLFRQSINMLGEKPTKNIRSIISNNIGYYGNLYHVTNYCKSQMK